MPSSSCTKCGGDPFNVKIYNLGSKVKAELVTRELWTVVWSHLEEPVE